MLIVMELVTIAVIIVGTFILFKSLGPQRGNLLYTKDDRQKWEAAVGTGMATWFTRANIVGTLTSLATVYLFFIGSSKLFGWWVFLCVATMLFSRNVTNYFTKIIWSSNHIKTLLQHTDLSGRFWVCVGNIH